ncbi:MAG TPA: hypothetical protein VF583_26585 [Bradyrhizobium sp.]
MAVVSGVITVMAINFLIDRSSMSRGRKQGLRLAVLAVALTLGCLWAINSGGGA